MDHSAEEWVVGEVHTNGIEGVWSLFKRSIVGTFHKMSAKHLESLSGGTGVEAVNDRNDRNIFIVPFASQDTENLTFHSWHDLTD